MTQLYSKVLCLTLVFSAASATKLWSFEDPISLVRSAASIIISESPRYSFGAHSPSTGRYDCSSFVLESVNRANLGWLPRDSRSQFEAIKKTGGRIWTEGSIGWRGLRPGDLIFFSGTFRHSHSNPISHVMIYAGENEMIGAQSSGVGLFRFIPTPPKGNPGNDSKSMWKRPTVYAYARPNWRNLELYAQIKDPKRASRRADFQLARWSRESANEPSPASLAPRSESRTIYPRQLPSRKRDGWEEVDVSGG